MSVSGVEDFLQKKLRCAVNGRLLLVGAEAQTEARVEGLREKLKDAERVLEENREAVVKAEKQVLLWEGALRQHRDIAGERG
jgi:hypothetical protein